MVVSEESALLTGKLIKRVTISKQLSLWMRRYRGTHKCVSSKAILLVLFWSFSVSLIHNCIFEGGHFLSNVFHLPVEYSPILFALESLVMCFYPLAGFLADTKYGRFKMISRSSQLLLLSIFMGIIITGIIFSGVVLSVNIAYTLFVFFCCLLGVSLFPVFILILGSLVMFNANIIQFGVDQLQDSPADHQSLFIYWYVWTFYLGVFMAQLGWSATYGVLARDFNFLILPILMVLCIMTIFTVVVIVHYKKHWFIIDTARTNPYKLVYRVTKFARQHKVPIHRSAFTYCEDDIPSGLDLGKSKYGGPFTTEEVENVKAFYGILKIVIALGITLFMNVASSSLLPYFFNHVSKLKINNYDYFNTKSTAYATYVIQAILFRDGFLSSLVVVLIMPLYISVIRSFISSYKIRIYGQIGLGIILLLLSLTSTVVTDTVVHIKNINATCMLHQANFFIYDYGSFHPAVLFPQQFFYGLSVMFIYPALYEFICAQSPHSMKGLFIGLSFAIRGISNLLSSLLLIPFMYSRFSLPSCGMEYYMMTIVVGVVGLAVYVYVARKYKLRERDEPCHVRRYVEEYYSKTQKEENYDY